MQYLYLRNGVFSFPFLTHKNLGLTFCKEYIFIYAQNFSLYSQKGK